MTVLEQQPIVDDRQIDIAPNQRYGIVGKTRSGKTLFAIALASLLVPYNSKTWEAWWIDSKDDPKDLEALHQWGFRKANLTKKRSLGLWKPDPESPRKIFYLRGGNIHEQAEEIFDKAYNKRNVLVIVDEYVQVVKSSQVAGEHLLNIFQRGGGIGVGLIGLTQEPVYVPRQLLSQATHQFLFNVSYPRDVAYLQDLYEHYIRPMRLPIEVPERWGNTTRQDHKHGFYHVAVDYDGEAAYFKNQFDWFKRVA